MSRVPSLLFLCLAGALAAAPAKKPVTVESITATRRDADAPRSPVWAPDGERFAYLQGKAVWLYDVPSRSGRELFRMDVMERTASKVPAAQTFAWENRHLTEQKIQWLPSGQGLLVSAGGDLFLFRLALGGWTQLTLTPEAERDPKLSPDGRRVSFRGGHDLYVLDLGNKAVTRLTHDGSATLGNGRLDWVYPEELDLGTAHWWSPDSNFVAYLQFDISREPLYPHADLLGLGAIAEPQRYPKAGEPNAEVRLGVVAATGGATKWMDLGETRDFLTARVAWLPDSKSLAATRLNRIQNRLDLMVAEASSGAARLLLRETDPSWINVQDNVRFLATSGQFLWSSERDGFRHLYLYSLDGRLVRQLTRGEWEAGEVSEVDEAAGKVYFLAREDTPLEDHLYVVGLDGTGRRRLSAPGLTHAVSMSATCEYYLDTTSSLTRPQRRAVHRNDGSEWAVFREADRKPLDEYEILPTEILRLKPADGATLYARLIKPAGFRPAKRYPAIVMVYGGPGTQAVRNAWAGANLDQALAQRGFVIWQLDNRGSAGRGHSWETALYRRLGAKELEDQKQGVRRLVSLGFVDSARIGVYGWSYGGFMTLNSLLYAPEVFKAGVAGAPVTDWRNYDTIYTERYLGLPSENAEGYRLSSPLHFADKLKGRLMLVHNFEDDNVLFQHTMQMANAFEKANKPFELMLYPQKTHGVSGPLRKHMLDSVVAFFERNL